MADNVAITAGAGTTIAADEVTEATLGTVKVQVVKLMDGTINGTGLIAGDATNGLDVDVTRIIPGTSATNLGKAEDAVHASGDTGVLALAVRQAANAPLSGADGDYEPLQTDANGHLKVNVIDALPTGSNTIGALTANQSVNTAQINGVAPSMGNGASGTGVQRVTIANDSTGIVALTTSTAEVGNVKNSGTFATQAAQSGTWTVQPGNTANTTAWKVDGSAVTQPVSGTVSITANSAVNVAQIAGTNTVTGGVAGIIAVGGNVANAVAATANPVPVGGIFTTTPATLTTGQTATAQFTAAQNLKQDIATIAGTAPTTVGKLDVKGADGDVFIRQATATNLNAAVVGTGTAGSPAGNILTVQGVASMTKLLVTPDSVALPANQSVNVSQINGVTPLMGSGIMGTGSPRVTIASDNDALTIKQATGTNLHAVLDANSGVDIGKLTANQSVNVAQINGVTTLMGNGVTGTGSQRVTVASDNTPFAVKTDQTTHGTTDLVAADITKIAGTAIVNGGLAGSVSVGGTAATNATITANPQNLGAQAVSSENTAVTTAKQVQLVADLVGKLIVLPYSNPENFVSGVISTAMTGTTSTSLIAAPAAGLTNYIPAITVSNSHATVGTDILIQDGSGGTTLWILPAASVYGGSVVTFPTPLRQPTTAAAIFAQNVTTGASTKVSACGYKGA